MVEVLMNDRASFTNGGTPGRMEHIDEQLWAK